MNNLRLVRKMVIIAVVLLLAVLYIVFFFISNYEALGSPEKENRALDRAVKSGNIKNCERLRGIIISGSDYEAVCRGNILEKQAWEKLDVSYCSTLESTIEADYCRERMAVAAVQKSQDVATCDGFSDDAKLQCQTAYWSARASGSSDAKLCDNIPNKDSALACRSELTRNRFLNAPADVSCDELPVAAMGECASFKAAVESKQGANCLLLQDAVLKSKCMQMVGKQ